ncbi:hypothetical protein PLESTB_000218400 [Pleodorina starrii]|uniref:GDP-D-glucose phosphorylase 1 n=1 Tax=Pleodorina starrii TaxID=330485 RepID=A0A9W6BCV8_9CHLO|nr:hypothetical protein PLESTM_001544100 [Pleodorina starrii]GLC49430.1 hypothetical protein PLESTB_000218400 [Pleodorina starrii]GLC75663.1 hypothetical protein PLESTF_001671400 [Pleodorina starrii]
MAAIHELVRRPSEAPRMPPVSSAPEATIASCLDSYLPVYSFSASQSWEKAPAPKLVRVDSLPVVPDFFSEPTCDSPPTLLGGGSSPPLSYYYLSDGGGSFNGLPADLYNHHEPQRDSAAADHLDAAIGLPYAKCRTPPADAWPRAPPTVGGGRAQPRRHPSDLLLPRVGHPFASEGDSGSDDAPLQEVPCRSVLETTLMTMWEERAERGLFRYDVTQCPTRVLPGKLGFVAQLNEGRATKKRPTELTVDRVLQPFDPAKFNFKKAAISEALVAFAPGNDDDGAAGAGGRRPPDLAAAGAAGAGAAGSSANSPNLVIINVSPIDYGHVLLVPRVLDNLPQAVSRDTVLLALQFARELGSPHFRVGYNSLGAYATINHLHFQSYYLAATLPCEVAPTAPLPGPLAAPPVPPSAPTVAAAAVSLPRKRQYDELMCGGAAAAAVRVSRLQGYPVNAFVVEAGGGAAAAGGIEAVAAVVSAAAERLQAVSQPFNLLMSDAGRRVFIFPQCFAERQAAGDMPPELIDTGVNPAAFEIAGHLLLKRAQDFEGASEELACRLLSQASLPEERFMAVARMCFGGACDGK